MRIARLVAAGIVAASLLTGCAKPVPPAPVLPTVPSACADSDDSCQRSGVVRWVVDLQMPVGVQITMAAGHLVWVGPYRCPAGVETPGWDCTIDAQWRFDPDSRTVWIVSNDTAFGVDAMAGVVPEWYRPWTVEEVLNLPVYQQEPISKDAPSSEISGLVGESANPAEFEINDPKNHLFVQVRVGCVAGSEQDIPGVSVSHGAPNWAQICTQPVLYAINY